MKEIIDWLIGIEDRAHKLYERAAMQLKDDKEFTDFLWYLAADEKVHYNFMREAAELIKGVYPPPRNSGSEQRYKTSGGLFFIM